MLKLFRRAAFPNGNNSPQNQPIRTNAPDRELAQQKVLMRTAEWHAARSQLCEVAGDPEEAREHLKDAGEFLAQIGGPLRPQSAGEIYQWCAGRRALEW